MPQNSAIWVKVSAVFSISHTAVALGISGSVMAGHFPGPSGFRRHNFFGRKPGTRRNGGIWQALRGGSRPRERIILITLNKGDSYGRGGGRAHSQADPA